MRLWLRAMVLMEPSDMARATLGRWVREVASAQMPGLDPGTIDGFEQATRRRRRRVGTYGDAPARE
jgi:hypothetical protein